MNNISTEPMSYKHQIHLDELHQLTTKLKIAKAVLVEKKNKVQVSKQFICHRNTVGNIISEFNNLPSELTTTLLHAQHLCAEDILLLMAPLKNQSTKPHFHSNQTQIEVERKFSEIFKNGLKYGPNRMSSILNRRYSDSTDPIEQKLSKLRPKAIRGIFKRQKLRLQKVKTANGNRRALYEYDRIGCFEYVHYDVKHILDKKALPQEIYDQLADNPDIPIYQWTLQDVKSRTRFLAYSHSYNAEFGLKFLIFGIGFIRVYLCNWDQSITVGIDNGVEFCSGSERKEAEWNQILQPLNCQIYSYEPGHDIRKNLIERSHRTDDEELYVPRGIYMKDIASFMEETKKYQYYFNFQRQHTGIGMNNKTPAEILLMNGVTGVKHLMQFPTICLENEIETLRKMTDQFLLFADIKNKEEKQKKKLDQKALLDLCHKYDFFDPSSAQKVLTYYRKCDPVVLTG